MLSGFAKWVFKLRSLMAESCRRAARQAARRADRRVDEVELAAARTPSDCNIRVILGLYWGFMGVLWRIMEKKMETTIVYRGYMVVSQNKGNPI